MLEDVKQRIDNLLDYDCSWGVAGVGRFRVNILRQRSSFMIVMRVIPFTIPTVESLQLPPVITALWEAERGMILVTGVTGSGKSSTLAAMVHNINATMHKHIVTLDNHYLEFGQGVMIGAALARTGVRADVTPIGLKEIPACGSNADVLAYHSLDPASIAKTAMSVAKEPDPAFQQNVGKVPGSFSTKC